MNIKKFLNRIVMILFVGIIINTAVEAASFSASASKTSVTVGETFSITVTASEASGTYEVVNSGASTSITSGNAVDFLDNSSATITYKTAEAGTITITAKATDMTDNNDDSKTVTGSKKITITVNPKEEPKEEVDDKKEEDNKKEETTKPEEEPKELTFAASSGKVYAKDSMNLRSSATTKSGSSNVITSLKKGTEMTISAKSTEKADGYYWYKVSANGKVGYVATSLVTTTKPEEDKEPPVLKGLVINEGAITPNFSKNTKTYNLSVEDIEKVTISTTPESGATAKITCNGATCTNGVVPINEGLNTITITVSKDGETNTYKVHVRKAIKEDEEGNITDEENEDTGLGLETLEIEAFELSPEFEKDIYSYAIVIPEDNDATSLNITTVANDEEAKVEIIDNENFAAGENIVTIMVTDKEGKTTRIYQIIVNKQVKEEIKGAAGIVEQTKEVVSKNLIPVIIICSLIILAIIILIVIIKSGKDEDNFEEELEEEVNKKDILDTEVSEEAYAENQYLNELREKENAEKNKEESTVVATKPKKGKHF